MTCKEFEIQPESFGKPFKEGGHWKREITLGSLKKVDFGGT